MTDEPDTQTQAQTPDEAPAAGTSSVRRALPRWLTRHTRRVIIVVTAIVAAIFVSAVTIDLGPAMRTRAEQVASTQIERQVHNAAERPMRHRELIQPLPRRLSPRGVLRLDGANRRFKQGCVHFVTSP